MGPWGRAYMGAPRGAGSEGERCNEKYQGRDRGPGGGASVEKTGSPGGVFFFLTHLLNFHFIYYHSESCLYQIYDNDILN